MYNRNIIKLRYHKKGNNVMNILGNEKYEANIKEVNTYKKEYEVKHYNNFYFHCLDTFYVISYYSSYSASSRQKTYKTYNSAVSAWAKIVSEETTYTNF